MHQVSIAKDANCLYIKLSGRITKSEAETVVDDVVPMIPRLKPGFGVISDISEFKIGDLGGVGVFKGVMEYLQTHGVGPVVRVTGTSKLGIVQFAKATGLVAGYKTHYVTTMEEAEETLRRLIFVSK